MNMYNCIYMYSTCISYQLHVHCGINSGMGSSTSAGASSINTSIDWSAWSIKHLHTQKVLKHVWKCFESALSTISSSISSSISSTCVHANYNFPHAKRIITFFKQKAWIHWNLLLLLMKTSFWKLRSVSVHIHVSDLKIFKLEKIYKSASTHKSCCKTCPKTAYM